MKAANDRGPVRHFATKAVDVRRLSEYFGIDKDVLRDFLIKHEGEISQRLELAATDFIEEVGLFEMLLPMKDLPEE